MLSSQEEQAEPVIVGPTSSGKQGGLTLPRNASLKPVREHERSLALIVSTLARRWFVGSQSIAFRCAFKMSSVASWLSSAIRNPILAKSKSTTECASSGQSALAVFTTHL